MQCFHFIYSCFIHNYSIVMSCVYCDVMIMYILQSVICISVIIVRIIESGLFSA